MVLGCPSAARLRRRVERGVCLWREGRAPLLLLSGGGRGPMPEALVMHRLALAAGVPQTALLIEPRSRDTLGNANKSAQLLRAHGLRSVVLVSDHTHLRRAALLFRLAGIEIAGRSGIRARSQLHQIGDSLREAAALPWSLAQSIWRRLGRRGRA